MVWWVLAACGSAGAGEVGAVMLVDGDASVVRDGARIPASIGLELEPTDTLVTGSDAALVVHLANDHVVRIDAELELPVGEVVMLRAARSTVPPGDQLADLVYPDERARLGGAYEQAARVAGWHARLTSAQAPSGVLRGGEEISVDLENESPSDAAPAAEPIKERSEPNARPEAGGAGRPRKPVSSRKVAAEPPPPPPPPPPGAPALEAKKSEEPAPIGVADIEARFGPGGDRRACVADWAAALPATVDVLEIRLRVEAGTLERAVLPGGLRLPACAREVLEGAPTGAADGSVVRIPLAP